MRSIRLFDSNRNSFVPYEGLTECRRAECTAESAGHRLNRLIKEGDIILSDGGWRRGM
jgi:hypothetical protein